MRVFEDFIEPVGHRRSAGLFLFILLASGLAGCRLGARDHVPMSFRDTTRAIIKTIDSEDGRAFVVNGRVRDLVDTITGRSQARFVAVMGLPTHFFLRPGRALLLGLGSGSILRNYRHERWSVRVAEPDEGVIRTAADVFRTSLPDTLLVHADGRAFLEGTEEVCEVLLVDGISPPSFPGHLFTEEFFTLAVRHLSADGMVAVAFEAVGWHDLLVESVGKTMARVFRQVLVLPIVEPPDRFGSVVLIGTNDPRDLVRDPDRNAFYYPDWRYGPEYQKVHGWDNHFPIDTTRGMVFTDLFDRNALVLTRAADSARVQPPSYLP
jgi:spermidine synthase